MRLTEAQRDLAERNLDLAKWQARMTASRLPNQYDDLVGEFSLAVAEAAGTYRPGKTAFSTHACWAIKSRRSVFLGGVRLVKIPDYHFRGTPDDAPARANNYEAFRATVEASYLGGEALADLSETPRNDVDDRDERSARMEWVRGRIDGLPADLRRVINLRLAGLTQLEVAKEMGCHRTHAHRMESRAVGILRGMLAQERRAL